MTPTVDFFINCWERDYREVLNGSFVRTKAASFAYPFRHRVATVNNVSDEQAARRLAQMAIDAGDVDRVVFVSDALPHALEVCGLRERDLGRVRHFTSYFLVIVTCTDAQFVTHCASDISLEFVFDWVTDAVEKMGRDERFAAANPRWGWDPAGADKEAIESDGLHLVLHGFTDAIVVMRRRDFAANVYSMSHPSDTEYPLHHIGAVFEQRVNAFMRHTGRLRLVDPRVTYHHSGVLGSAYPQQSSWRRLLSRARMYFREG